MASDVRPAYELRPLQKRLYFRVLTSAILHVGGQSITIHDSYESHYKHINLCERNNFHQQTAVECPHPGAVKNIHTLLVFH